MGGVSKKVVKEVATRLSKKAKQTAADLLEKHGDKALKVGEKIVDTGVSAAKLSAKGAATSYGVPPVITNFAEKIIDRGVSKAKEKASKYLKDKAEKFIKKTRDEVGVNATKSDMKEASTEASVEKVKNSGRLHGKASTKNGPRK
jgi:vacuolar-type H+-ATPase subunit H